MPNPRISSARLYGFIDAAYLGGRDPGKIARAMAEGGVDVLQVRAKGWAHPKIVELGMVVFECGFPRGRSRPIINDDIEAAFEMGAAGVHLGQEDWAGLARDNSAATDWLVWESWESARIPWSRR